MVAKHDELAWAGEEYADYSPSQKAVLEDLYRRTEERLSAKAHRLAHSRQVAATARRLAHAHGVDPFMAEAAGILHDWDKVLTSEQLWRKVDMYRIPVSTRDERMTPVLHGMTAAASLSRELDLPPEVFQAIARHTLGAPGMSELDIVIYCADMLEPGRGSVMDGLRSLALGPLPVLFASCVQSVMDYLISAGRYVSVESVATWNSCYQDLPADAVTDRKHAR